MKRFVISMAMVCGLGWPKAGLATLMQPLGLADLVRRADRVVSVRIEQTASRLTSDQKGIVTLVTVRVQRAYKGPGQLGDRFSLIHEGGQVGNVNMQVLGSPQFTVGEEAIVFTEERNHERYVVGMVQGKIGVSRRSDGTAWVAMGPLAGARPAGGHEPVQARKEKRLEDFENELSIEIENDRVRRSKAPQY